MLDFFVTPAASAHLKTRIVGENPAQMVGVGAAIELDDRGGLDDPDKLGVELVPIEPVPRDIIETPNASCRLPARHRIAPIHPCISKLFLSRSTIFFHN